MGANVDELLRRLLANSRDRGWFSLSTCELDEIAAIRQLESNGWIQLDSQDVRIDHVSGRVKAGEFVGVVLNKGAVRAGSS